MGTLVAQADIGRKLPLNDSTLMTLALSRDGRPMPARPVYLPPGAAAVLDLRPGACRWPLGEADQDGFRFCLDAAGHRTYCPAHSRLARRSAP